MTTERTHKLVLESVTLNFRLWDGPPPAKDRPSWDAPEWSTGRPFATVEVHQLGTHPHPQRGAGYTRGDPEVPDDPGIPGRYGGHREGRGPGQGGEPAGPQP